MVKQGGKIVNEATTNDMDTTTVCRLSAITCGIDGTRGASVEATRAQGRRIHKDDACVATTEEDIYELG